MFGRFIFNFIGGVVRWIYGTIWRTIANKPRYKFSEYLSGPENSEDWFDQKGHSFVNWMIGVVAMAIIGWIISRL